MMWYENLKSPSGFKETLLENLEINSKNKSIQQKNGIVPFQLVRMIIHKYSESQFSRYLLGNDSLEDIISKCYISSNFRNKQIYLINDNLFQKLSHTVGMSELSAEILDKLPYNALYLQLQLQNSIKIQGESVEGCFVARETYMNFEKKEDSIVLILIVKRGNTNRFIPLQAEIGSILGKSLEICWSKRVPKSEKEEIESVLKNFLQVLVYMCSIEPDIKKVRRGGSKNKRLKSKSKPKPKPADYYEVGYIIGKTLGATQYIYEGDNPSEQSTNKGTAKSTHFRRPHWHTYKIGKGRVESVVKWIDAIWVNAEKADTSKPTLHKIKS